MRGLALMGDDGDVDLDKAGFFEEAVERALFEAEPTVGVELVGFLEGVRLQIEDDELPVGFENAEGLLDGALRVLGVVQGLAEDGEVDAGVGEGHGLDVAEEIAEVFQTVLTGQLCAYFYHTRRVVDTPDLGGATGEQLRDHAFARAEIGDDDAGYKSEREVPDGFPGAAGAVVFAQAARDEIEIFLGLAPAAGEDAVQVGPVVGGLGLVGDGVSGGAQEDELARVDAGAQRIVGALAVAAVDDETGLAQQRELGGNARLGHIQNLLNLGHGELLVQQQSEETQTGGVGEDFERVPGGFHRELNLARMAPGLHDRIRVGCKSRRQAKS